MTSESERRYLVNADGELIAAPGSGDDVEPRWREGLPPAWRGIDVRGLIALRSGEMRLQGDRLLFHALRNDWLLLDYVPASRARAASWAGS